MKRLLVLVLFIFAAASVSAAVNTVYYGKSPNILVSLASQDPDPVEPGKIVELRFKLDNQGTVANNIMLETIPEFPFSLLPGESAVKEVGTLGASQNSERSIFVKYKMKVDQNAVDGDHEILVRYKSDDSEAWITIKNITVKVQSKEAILSVEKIITQPEIIEPGSKSSLTISLMNHASSLIKDIKIILDLGESGDEETPFAPVGSTNEKVISSIDAKASDSVEFELLADPDAKSKVYKVPIIIQYLDVLNKNYSRTLTAALVVGSQPDLSLYIDSSTIYSAGKTGEVTVKIVNKGLTDIKFLNVNLDDAEGYEIISPPNVYIGNIDSDDYESIDFKLSVEKTKNKKVVLPLTVEYKDANNQNYKKNFKLELPLYSSSEAKKMGLVKGTSKFAIFVMILAVAAVIFIAYRTFKRRRK